MFGIGGIFDLLNVVARLVGDGDVLKGRMRIVMLERVVLVNDRVDLVGNVDELVNAWGAAIAKAEKIDAQEGRVFARNALELLGVIPNAKLSTIGLTKMRETIVR